MYPRRTFQARVCRGGGVWGIELTEVEWSRNRTRLKTRNGIFIPFKDLARVSALLSKCVQISEEHG